jgi:allophanate hydrolase subunit 2
MLVINAGFKSKLVDLGREGLQHIGYCQAGPADQNSYKLANLLLRNPPDAVAIEIMFGGLELLVEEDMLVCLTGADCALLVDAKQYAVNQVVSVHAGQQLRVSTPGVGLYSYLALSNEVNAPLFLHSVCAVERERLGGLNNDGDGLQASQRIEFKSRPQESTQQVSKSIPISQVEQIALKGLVTPISKTISIRFIPGYQYPDFAHTQVAIFKG